VFPPARGGNNLILFLAENLPVLAGERGNWLALSPVEDPPVVERERKPQLALSLDGRG